MRHEMTNLERRRSFASLRMTTSLGRYFSVAAWMRDLLPLGQLSNRFGNLWQLGVGGAAL